MEVERLTIGGLVDELTKAREYFENVAKSLNPEEPSINPGNPHDNGNGLWNAVILEMHLLQRTNCALRFYTDEAHQGDIKMLLERVEAYKKDKWAGKFEQIESPVTDSKINGGASLPEARKTKGVYMGIGEISLAGSVFERDAIKKIFDNSAGKVDMIGRGGKGSARKIFLTNGNCSRFGLTQRDFNEYVERIERQNTYSEVSRTMPNLPIESSQLPPGSAIMAADDILRISGYKFRDSIVRRICQLRSFGRVKVYDSQPARVLITPENCSLFRVKLDELEAYVNGLQNKVIA